MHPPALKLELKTNSSLRPISVYCQEIEFNSGLPPRAHPPDTYTNMTYLPPPCFELIKSFLGIHPAKFHCKKVAALIKRAKIKHTIRRNQGYATSHYAQLIRYPGGARGQQPCYYYDPRDVSSWITYSPELKGCRKEFTFDYKCTGMNTLPSTTPLQITSWRGRPQPKSRWLEAAGQNTISQRHFHRKVENTIITQHILLRKHNQADLKEYCKVNNMVGWKHPPLGIIAYHHLSLERFILKYKFE